MTKAFLKNIDLMIVSSFLQINFDQECVFLLNINLNEARMNVINQIKHYFLQFYPETINSRLNSLKTK